MGEEGLAGATVDAGEEAHADFVGPRHRGNVGLGIESCLEGRQKVLDEPLAHAPPEDPDERPLERHEAWRRPILRSSTYTSRNG
jgi:hypothetical protein